MIINVFVHVKYPLFLSDFNRTSIFSKEFRNELEYQITSKSIQGEPSCSCGRTDRHDEANTRFSQFCERSYKWLRLSPHNGRNSELYASATGAEEITRCEVRLREEHRLTVFANSVLRKILWPTMDETERTGCDSRTRGLMICPPHQKIFA